MAALPDIGDPTLQEADRALERRQDRRRRPYLGMSAIGKECERELWYGFRWVQRVEFDAATIKRFEDGHRGEAIIIERLKAVPGIELHDVDERGDQWGFTDFGGHFRGHKDGVVLGILQAPKTWHTLEIKISDKWQELDKTKRKFGPKLALREWNPVYYAQAVLYMDYAGLDRHYLICGSPGARRETSVRTDADPAFALVLKAKAERIIFSDHAPKRIGGPDSFACRFCDFRAICHSDTIGAERNCRTCLHSEVLRQGGWRCQHWGHELSVPDQEAGCPSHRFLPDLVPGEQVDVSVAGDIAYRMTTGATWTDRGPA
jgi:hypothetical protein